MSNICVPYAEMEYLETAPRRKILQLETEHGGAVPAMIQVLQNEDWFETELYGIDMVNALRGTVLDSPETAHIIEEDSSLRESMNGPRIVCLTTDKIPALEDRTTQLWWANRHTPMSDMQIGVTGAVSQFMLRNPSFSFQWDSTPMGACLANGADISRKILLSPCISLQLCKSFTPAKAMSLVNNRHLPESYFFWIVDKFFHPRVKPGHHLSGLAARIGRISNPQHKMSLLKYCLIHSRRDSLVKPSWFTASVPEALKLLNPNEKFDDISEQYLWPLLMESIISDKEIQPLEEVARNEARSLNE